MSPLIELLYFADCPNYQRALADLRAVLTRMGIAAEVVLIAVETQAEAERQQFYGSPTIRIEGADIAPPSGALQPALACRVYHDASGRPTPTPPLATIQAARARGSAPA